MAASLLPYTKRERANSSAVGKGDQRGTLPPEANSFPPHLPSQMPSPRNATVSKVADINHVCES